jgi:hypothetical protein
VRARSSVTIRYVASSASPGHHHQQAPRRHVPIAVLLLALPPHRSEVVRVNRGYKLREDLVKACKRLALDTDRNLYEVMEEALREHLRRHGIGTSP